jgi:hypothetical protein
VFSQVVETAEVRAIGRATLSQQVDGCAVSPMRMSTGMLDERAIGRHQAQRWLTVWINDHMLRSLLKRRANHILGITEGDD